MKHAYLLLLAAVMLLTFSACRSTKGLDRTKGHVSGTTVSGTSSTAHDDANAAATALVKEITAQPLAPSCLTAKVKVDLEGMGKSISVNGQLRMKRDDVVQLSLTFLGMEVGRMEFTPQDVLIIDRMNKQYVRAAYSEVGFLQRANLDFYALQALFWNELFIPGERNVGAHASRFRLSEASGRRALTLTGTPRLNYTFYAAPSSARGTRRERQPVDRQGEVLLLLFRLRPFRRPSVPHGYENGRQRCWQGPQSSASPFASGV